MALADAEPAKESRQVGVLRGHQEQRILAEGCCNPGDILRGVGKIPGSQITSTHPASSHICSCLQRACNTQTLLLEKFRIHLISGSQLSPTIIILRAYFVLIARNTIQTVLHCVTPQTHVHLRWPGRRPSSIFKNVLTRRSCGPDRGSTSTSTEAPPCRPSWSPATRPT